MRSRPYGISMSSVVYDIVTYIGVSHMMEWPLLKIGAMARLKWMDVQVTLISTIQTGQKLFETENN